MSTALAASADAPVLRTDCDGVVTLTLNRPAKYNPLSNEMLAALHEAMAAIAADPAARVVVLADPGCGRRMSRGSRWATCKPCDGTLWESGL